MLPKNLVRFILCHGFLLAYFVLAPRFVEALAVAPGGIGEHFLATRAAFQSIYWIAISIWIAYMLLSLSLRLRSGSLLADR